MVTDLGAMNHETSFLTVTGRKNTILDMGKRIQLINFHILLFVYRPLNIFCRHVYEKERKR